MKKLFFYAAAGALSITALTPTAAYAASSYNFAGQNGKVVVIGGNISGNGNSQDCEIGTNIAGSGNLSNILENIQNMIQNGGIDCPTLPGGGTGGNGGSQPDNNKPGINIPGINKPDNGQPDNSQPGGDSSQDEFTAQVVKLVNEERAKAGLSPLTVNAKAASAAQTRAKEITTSFSHTRPNGSSFSTALNEAGVSYTRSGENIAYGQRTPEAVMNAWMNSAGHRANILNANFTEIGVGHYTNGAGVSYWTQLFIK